MKERYLVRAIYGMAGALAIASPGITVAGYLVGDESKPKPNYTRTLPFDQTLDQTNLNEVPVVGGIADSPSPIAPTPRTNNPRTQPAQPRPQPPKVIKTTPASPPPPARTVTQAPVGPSPS